VQWVGDGVFEDGEEFISMKEYEATVASPALPDEKGCRVYILSKPPKTLCAKDLLLGEDSRVLRMTAVVTWPGRGRGLAGKPVGTNTTLVLDAGSGISMVPTILEGLLVGALLLFFSLVGLSCVTSITSPDILMSTSLPAGKEY